MAVNLSVVPPLTLIEDAVTPVPEIETTAFLAANPVPWRVTFVVVPSRVGIPAAGAVKLGARV